VNKKEAKKTLFTAGSGTTRAKSSRTKSFLLPQAGSLFFKKEALAFF